MYCTFQNLGLIIKVMRSQLRICYRFKHIPRVAKTGVEVLLSYIKKHIQLKKGIQPTVTSMEILETTININARRIRCITI